MVSTTKFLEESFLSMTPRSLVFLFILGIICSTKTITAVMITAVTITAVDAGELVSITARYQQQTSQESPRFHRLHQVEQLPIPQVAVIVCDMWDSHHSISALRRMNELAPRVSQLINHLRSQGAVIIHAPSSCMAFYDNHSARKRVGELAAAANYPEGIGHWCESIAGEDQTAFPLERSANGEDDDATELLLWRAQLASLGRNPQAPWLSQMEMIEIVPSVDFISDSGMEIWNILEAKKITHILMLGVHANGSILGGPFGLRRWVTAGKKVFLVRDLTDAMYSHRDWPHTNHFSATDLIINHIERYVCPTVSSEQLLGGSEFRFSADRRPQLTMIIADDEYKTEESLPEFAAKHLGQSFRITAVYGSEAERNKIVSIDEVATADVILISVRRRWLPEADLRMIRQFAHSGRPMIGIRTASHAFSMRSEKPPVGYAEWPEFDAEIWGGNYTNHYGKQTRAKLTMVESAIFHPIIQATGLPLTIQPGGSLYRTSPLAPGTHPLIMGSVGASTPEPVAWTYVRVDGGRSFYTSLGHIEDFAQAQFEALLSAGIHWACQLPIPEFSTIQQQSRRYGAGQGGQGGQ